MQTMMFRPRTGGSAEGGSEQLIHNVVDSALGDRLRDASTQMRLQNVTADPIQGALHRGQLVEDVDAVTVVLHHAYHPVKMATSRAKSQRDRLRRGSHRPLWRI